MAVIVKGAGGGYDESDITARAAHVLNPYTTLDASGEITTGTIVTKSDAGNVTLNASTTSKSYAAGYYPNAHGATHATVDIPDPTISVASNGLITASGSWTAGFTSDTSYSSTKQLTALGATTYNTSASDLTISSGKYITGVQTIKAVTTSGISAANIKDGVTVNVGDANDADRIVGVTGTFTDSSTVSSGQSAVTAATLLTGRSAFIDGAEVKGTMANQGAVTSTISSLGGTYTIPAGYHNGSGVITASLGAGAITSGSGAISIGAPSYNTTSGSFGLSASVTISAPTVGTAGYVSSSAGTKTGNTASGSRTLSKIVGKTTLSGNNVKLPVISRQAFTISGVTDAASGAATTTKPSSGVYVKVNTATNTGTITATPSVTTEGYGTSSYHGIVAGSDTVGASASADTYVPITTTSASVSGKTVSYGTGWITGGSKSVADGSATTPATTVYTGKPTVTFSTSNGVISVASASGTADVTPSVSAGYVTAGTKGTITAASNATTYTVGLGSINAITGSATQSTPGMSFNALNGVVTATVAATSLTAYANTKTAGYVPVAERKATLSMALSSNTYSVGIASVSNTGGGASGATVTGWVNSTAGYTAGFNHKITATVASGSVSTPATTVYTGLPSVSLNTGNGVISITSVSGTKSVTPSVTAGYITSGTAGTITATSNATSFSLSTQAAKTVTPSTSTQTAVEANKYTLGAVTVAAIQTLTKTATTNGDITPDSGYYLNKVTVAIPVYNGLIS